MNPPLNPRRRLSDLVEMVKALGHWDYSKFSTCAAGLCDRTFNTDYDVRAKFLGITHAEHERLFYRLNQVYNCHMVEVTKDQFIQAATSILNQETPNHDEPSPQSPS